MHEFKNGVWDGMTHELSQAWVRHSYFLGPLNPFAPPFAPHRPPHPPDHGPAGTFPPDAAGTSWKALRNVQVSHYDKCSGRRGSPSSG